MLVPFQEYEARIVELLGSEHEHHLERINAVKIRWERDPEPAETVPMLVLSEPQSDREPFLAAAYTGNGMQKNNVFFRMVQRDGNRKNAVLKHVDDVETKSVIEKSPIWPFDDFGTTDIASGHVAMHHLVLYYLTKHGHLAVNSRKNMNISAKALTNAIKSLKSAPARASASHGNVNEVEVKQQGIQSSAARRVPSRTSNGNELSRDQTEIRNIRKDIEEAGLSQILSNYRFSPWERSDDVKYRGAQPIKLAVGVHQFSEGVRPFYACIVPKGEHELVRFFTEGRDERGERPQDLPIRDMDAKLLNKPFDLTNSGRGELVMLVHWCFIDAGHCTKDVRQGMPKFRGKMQKWLSRISKAWEVEEQEDDSLVIVGGGDEDSMLKTGTPGKAPQPLVGSSANMRETSETSASRSKATNATARKLLGVDADEVTRLPVSSFVNATQESQADDSQLEDNQDLSWMDALVADTMFSPKKPLRAGSGPRLMPVAKMVSTPTRTSAKSANVASNTSETVLASERDRTLRKPNGRRVPTTSNLERPGTTPVATPPTESLRGPKRNALVAGFSELNERRKRIADIREEKRRQIEQSQKDLEQAQKVLEQTDKIEQELNNAEEELSAAKKLQSEFAEELNQAQAAIDENTKAEAEANKRWEEINAEIKALEKQRSDEIRKAHIHKVAKEHAGLERAEIEEKKRPVDVRVENGNAKVKALETEASSLQ